MRIATHTLGCKLNFAETSHLQRSFEQAGFNIVGFHEKADIYVVNSCTVTSVAEKKCRNAIRQAVSQNPDAIVAVIGCFAQNEAERIAQIPGVDIILGNEQKHRLLEILTSRHFHPSHSPLINTDEPHSFQLSYSKCDRTRTFFKIQDGCDYYCTYCAIPFARGRSRSAPIADTVAAARQIAAGGAREIVLTGVNTGTFGQRNGEHLIDLLRELDGIDKVSRYRISSIEPNLLTDEIIDFVASSRAFLPHFHIPLQSGADKVLHAMHRRYDTALYAQRLEHIKRVMPDACIAADVITGFNYEDDETFVQSKAFINSLPISYLHVFPYSDRPHTAALKMGEKVPIPIRKARSNELRELSDAKRRLFVESQLGKTRTVLWEHTQHDGTAGPTMQGWTDNYIRLHRPFDPALAGRVTPYDITPSTIVANYSCDD
ncbi:MAG: tRNA (N(6)-L-threonylcarbamoyladenosine(37)-C(2))-methylthiotransferase MtaB [Bacteroidales bacterium]|nr:tRNA (N(6)-L-threonylcarbamoyladenosine(37)-C(2))-methylthiotransferase MtaB [Bacteroidales bacterium]